MFGCYLGSQPNYILSDARFLGYIVNFGSFTLSLLSLFVQDNSDGEFGLIVPVALNF